MLAIPGAAQDASPVVTTLYSFNPDAGDGYSPVAALTIGSGDVLYGTARWVYGTVFSLSPPLSAGEPWSETVLYYFTGGADGSVPLGSVAIGSNGVLYTTGSSTIDFGGGAVVSLTPGGPGGSWTPTVLYDFSFGSSGGAEPHAGVVVGADGFLYGTTTDGGGCHYEYGCGTVYSLLHDTETPLYDLPGTGGVDVSALVMDSAGVLYGTAWWYLENGTGKTKYGSYVFSATPPASPGGSWTGAEIYRFSTGTDDPLGSLPLAGVVIGDGGVLYGTTSTGAKHGNGAVFSVTPPASPGELWTGTALYDFPEGNQAISPGGLVYDSARGVLYGVTLSGGSDGHGTAFALSPPSSLSCGWTYRLLHTFTGGNDGAGPNTLVLGSGGLLYGTTQAGGLYQSGTVFSLKP